MSEESLADSQKPACKLRAAELRDEALFKDPLPMEECPICFLPMPINLINCITLPPATISSVPIYDFAIANEELEEYFSCCGKTICQGCVHSFNQTGNDDKNGKCAFCNSDRNNTKEERVQEMMRRVNANDPNSICMLANSYHRGLNGFQQDQTKTIELYVRAAELGSSKAYGHLGNIYREGGNMKKAKFHNEEGAMAGHEMARNNLGVIEYNSGNVERAVKHWTIAASAGEYLAMHHLKLCFERGHVSRESVSSTLEAYNNSCKEMRSEARDAYRRAFFE